ncbi:MAG: GspE/PulE family protein [Christensenellales bacterium]
MKFIKDILCRLAYDNKIEKDKIDDYVAMFESCNEDAMQFLVKRNICDESTYYQTVAQMCHIPFSEMGMLDIDKSLMDKFSLQFLKKNKLVPVCRDNKGVLIVACGNIFNAFAKSTLAMFGEEEIEFVLVPPKDIDNYIDSIVAVKTTENALSDLEKEKTKKQVVENDVEIDEQFDEVKNAPAVRLVDSFIKEAIPFRASDIHIEPYENEVKVRYRIDGDLSDRLTFPYSYYPAVCARLKIISGMDIAERRVPQDGRINMNVNGVEYDFRVSTLPTVNGEKFVIRVLDKSSFNFTRKELQFTESENELINKILKSPHGLILLTGPTGCGKSTTLYSFLNELNKPNVNIVTVEDPVEYTMLGINQTQVNTKTNMTFATALRSILRQDPDIIMVGEIRDEETAQISIRAGITGHLVLSTLHTNNAPGAVARLIDMGIAPYFVSDALVAVISQRLVKKLCPACKKRVLMTAEEMKALGIAEPKYIYKAVGCPYCNHTGYKGRVAVHEIMYMNENIRNALVNGVTEIDAIKKIAVQNGMITLADAGKQYLFDGITSFEELMKIIVGE